MAPRRGLEPLTFRLTAERSTIELPGNRASTLQSYTVAAACPTRGAYGDLLYAENKPEKNTFDFHHGSRQTIAGLLHAGDAGIETNQGIENRQDVPAVFHHSREHVAEARFALSLAVPSSQDVNRHFDIAAKFLGRMAAQKQSVEEGGFALRVLKFPQRFFSDNELLLTHTRKCSLPKLAAASRGTEVTSSTTTKHPFTLAM